MLGLGVALAFVGFFASSSFAQMPARVVDIAECNLELSHADLAKLQADYLQGDWRAVQQIAARARTRLETDCAPIVRDALPTDRDRVLFSWIAAGADGVTRVHSAFHPMQRPYDLSFDNQTRYFEVVLADRRGVTMVGRITSEAKESPLVASATALLATSAGQIATALSNASLGLPTNATAAAPSTESSVMPLALPAKTLASEVSATPLSTDSIGQKVKEVVIARVRRVDVPHRFGAVKSIRKLTRPMLPAEVTAEFRKAAAPIRGRWIDDPHVARYLEVAAEVASSAIQHCPEDQNVSAAVTAGGSAASECRAKLVKSLASAAPRSSMSTTVAIADAEVRTFFADLSAPSYDDDLTLRHDQRTRVGFTTMTGYVLKKSSGASARVKIAGDRTDYDPLPSATVGFGLSLSAHGYRRGADLQSLGEKLRAGGGVVVAPNLGAYVTVGFMFLPRVGAVIGTASLRVPTAVNADRSAYLRGWGHVGFLGLQVEFQ